MVKPTFTVLMKWYNDLNELITIIIRCCFLKHNHCTLNAQAIYMNRKCWVCFMNEPSYFHTSHRYLALVPGKNILLHPSLKKHLTSQFSPKWNRCKHYSFQKAIKLYLPSSYFSAYAICLFSKRKQTLFEYCINIAARCACCETFDILRLSVLSLYV